jgi:voltage-gated potassium channel
MAIMRYRLIIELSALFLVVWSACAVLIYYYEVGSNFRIHHPLEAVYFMLVTMMTSGDSAIVPVSLAGRIVMGIAVVVSKLLTALLCALAAAVMIEQNVKEEMGLKMHSFSHHIVIIGWNLKGSQIVANLLREPKNQTTPIVIMAELEQKPYEDPLVHFTRSTYPIRGEAIRRSALAKASLVVVLAKYSEQHHADSLTAVNCLLAHQVSPQARIIAELLDPAQRPSLEAAGATTIVGIGEIGGFLLSEAAAGRPEVQQLLDTVAGKNEAAVIS